MRRITKILGVVALGGLFATAAVAATLSPADAIAQRQAGFKKIGGTFKALNEQLKSPTPDKAQIASLATQMKVLTPAVAGWFPVGSGPEAGVKTGAKAEIWAKQDEFKADAKALAVESDKLSAIAAGGDVTAIQAQAKVVYGKCMTCHTAFRQKDS